MIHWKCNEEKTGWRVHASLLLQDGVTIESEILIPRDMLQDDTLHYVVGNMQYATEQRRAEHEAQKVTP